MLVNEVATLVDEEKQVGTYEVEFSAKGGDGNVLPSGIYFYTLTAEPSAGSGQAFIQTKKMVLLRRFLIVIETKSSKYIYFKMSLS